MKGNPVCGWVVGWLVEALDHYVGGLDESSGGVAFFQLEFADCVGCDDGGDVGVAQGEDDFGEEAFDADADYFSGELISSADAAVAFARCDGWFGFVFQEIGPQRGLRNAMVAAWSLEGLEFAAEDPLLDGGVAYSNEAGCFAWCEHLVGGGHGLFLALSGVGWADQGD